MIACEPVLGTTSLPNRQIEVHVRLEGGRYSEVRSVEQGESIALARFADVAVAVDEVLPKVSEGPAHA